MSLLNAVGTASAPTDGTSGKSCASQWRTSPRGEKYLVCLQKATGASAVTMAAPVILWGYDNDQWYEIKRLNAAAAIVMNTANGYSEMVDFLGIWERLAISSGAITGSHTVSASVIELQNTLIR